MKGSWRFTNRTRSLVFANGGLHGVEEFGLRQVDLEAFFGILRAMGTQRARYGLSTTYTSNYARSLNMISGILFY